MYLTTIVDYQQVFANLGHDKSTTELRDFDRDGAVNSTDAQLVLSYLGLLVNLDLPVAQPLNATATPAALPDSSPSAAAFALASEQPDPQLEWIDALAVAEKESPRARISLFAQLGRWLEAQRNQAFDDVDDLLVKSERSDSTGRKDRGGAAEWLKDIARRRR